MKRSTPYLNFVTFSLPVVTPKCEISNFLCNFHNKFISVNITEKFPQNLGLHFEYVPWWCILSLLKIEMSRVPVGALGTVIGGRSVVQKMYVDLGQNMPFSRQKSCHGCLPVKENSGETPVAPLVCVCALSQFLFSEPNFPCWKITVC